MKYSKLYDISVVIQEDKDNFVKTLPLIPIGDRIFNGFRIEEMNVHYGTHLDAPCHLTPNKKTIDEYPLDRFILPAIVIESMDTDSVKPEDVKKANITPGCAVLLKTENSRSGRSKKLPYEGTHVCVELETLEYLFSKGVTMVGFDSPHGERDAATMEDQKSPVHQLMFAHDCINLESIDLQNVPEGEYTLIALPVKFVGVNGSPARAILLKEE